MCTVSWLLRPGGFVLLTNRDERDTRAPAEPPELRVQEGVPYLAPTDPDAGGTWVTANALGTAVTVLNDDEGEERTSCASRGELVRALAHLGGVDEVAAALYRADLERYRGFRLVALAPDRAPEHFRWDRRELTRGALAPEDRPLVSSTFHRRPGIEAARRAAWGTHVAQEGEPTVERLLAFHRSRDRGASPESVSMAGGGARTVSASWIEVDPHEVRFRYCPTTPAAGDFGAAALLLRRGGR